MKKLQDLALAIDSASDAGDEEALRELGEECEESLDGATGDERVFLLYYQANTYGAIVSAKSAGPANLWDWELPDAVQNVLLLRRAIAEPSFGTIDQIRACQIRTNLANRLNALGRPVAANEQWLKVLETEPRFAKALANRAQAIAFYATTLYDKGHEVCLLAAARTIFDAALSTDALWESGDRDTFAPSLADRRDSIQTHLVDVAYDEDFEFNQFTLGATEEERSYRRWCLRERLFLNPLNDQFTESVAAADVLHLPDHTYKIGEAPRFPAYYNLLKQEYVSARYRLFHAIHRHDPDFIMRDVLMLDSGEGQALGHYSEDLKSAFRSAYSLFDKVGLFLNDYFEIGLTPGEVNFRRVWSHKASRNTFELRPNFRDRPNWPLRGMYFLSKDLYDRDFLEVSEPDAVDLAALRNQVEHRFLSLQESDDGASSDTHRLISIAGFEGRTLRLLRMAREALIYLSLAMHREETLREEASQDDAGTKGSLVPGQVESFQRP